MIDYTDCVLRKETRDGRFICYGLVDTICANGVKCPFYASNKDYERDKKTGYIRKRKETIK